ncbi:MAG TPA: alpha amylase C-terminal domain-containing protein, partial [Cellvibrionaceae bacterium]
IGGTPWAPRNYLEFSSQNFHPSCDTNYADASSVWSCELYGMPDLDHSLPYVQNTIGAYIKRLSDMGIDGFRIDAAKHMPPTDIEGFLQAAGNPWVFLEVIGAAGEASQIQPPNYTYMGPVTEMGYGPAVASNFNGQIKNLQTLGSSWGLLPSADALVFIDNHDRERGHGGGGNLTYKDGTSYNLANVFMLAFPYGYPKVMSGYSFSDTDAGPPAPGGCDANGWVCQHRWDNIANMVGFRNATIDAWSVDNWWDNNDNAIAFGRGSQGFVLINNQNYRVNQTLQTGLPAGEYCNVLAGSAECSGEIISVNAQGFAQFDVAAKSAAAIHANAISGSNQAPTAVITNAPSSVNIGQAFTLSGSDSFDPDGSIVDYLWSSGATTPEATFTLGSAGQHILQLTVTDNQGATHSANVTVNAQSDTGFMANFDSLLFRGTSNGWQTTAMTLVADHTWQLDVMFDGQSNQRFKLDVFGDWSVNFGDNNNDGILDQTGSDIFTGVSGHYRLTVNDQTLGYQLNPLGGFSSEWDQVFARGTFNNWGCTAMTLNADNTWSVQVELSGGSNQRYKFDRNCDWSDNYGDSNSDGSLERNGADIYNNSAGSVTLEVNDSDLQHTLY